MTQKVQMFERWRTEESLSVRVLRRKCHLHLSPLQKWVAEDAVPLCKPAFAVKRLLQKWWFVLTLKSQPKIDFGRCWIDL